MVDVECQPDDIWIHEKVFAKKSKARIIHWYWILRTGLRLIKYNMSSEPHRFTFPTFPVENMKVMTRCGVERGDNG